MWNNFCRVCTRKSSSRQIRNYCPVDVLSEPDLSQYPLFSSVHLIDVALNPGECLLIPAYWFHAVRSLADHQGRNIAINFFYDINPKLAAIFEALAKGKVGISATISEVLKHVKSEL